MKRTTITLILSLILTSMIYSQSVKVILILDKSGSIDFYNTPKPKIEDVLPLIKYIQREGGKLAISTLGVTSKQYLEEIKSGNSNTRPRQKRGQSAREYRIELRKFLDSSSERLTDEQIDNFISSSQIKKIFDYSSLESASDVSGALELAEIYLNETDKEFSDAKKFIIIVSDGQNNQQTYKAPENLKYTLLVVNRSKEIGILKNYKFKLFSNLSSAIDYITK